jgi:hypothetical protein
MRKILLAGVLAALAMVALPDRSFAWGKSPYNSHGYGWLGSMAFRWHSWIHMDGPLYNYGPYNTPGLVVMHIPQPYHGSYTPADPTLWNRGYAPYGPVAGYPAYGVPGYLPANMQPAPGAPKR